MALETLNGTYVFFSYAQRDKALRDQLENHLSNLKYRGLITTWHDREIHAGEERARHIDIYLNNARIILLLISAHFMASEYCYGLEMKRALERHQQGEAHVIPILLRPVLFTNAPFAELQMLPKNGKPVVKWSDRDSAFVDIACEIEKIALIYKAKVSSDTYNKDVGGKRGTQSSQTLWEEDEYPEEEGDYPDEPRTLQHWEEDDYLEDDELLEFDSIPIQRKNTDRQRSLDPRHTPLPDPPRITPLPAPLRITIAKRIPLLPAALVVFILSFLSFGIGFFYSPSSAGNTSTGGTHPVAPSTPIATIIFLLVGVFFLCLGIIVAVLHIIRAWQKHNNIWNAQQLQQAAQEFIRQIREWPERRRLERERRQSQEITKKMQRLFSESAPERYRQSLREDIMFRELRTTGFIQEVDEQDSEVAKKRQYYEDTLRAYQNATMRGSYDSAAQRGLGNTYFALQNYTEAFSAFRRAFYMQPMAAATWAGMGNIFAKLQLHQQAIEAYEEALRLDNDIALDYDELVQALMKIGRVQEAERYRKRARELGYYDE